MIGKKILLLLCSLALSIILFELLLHIFCPCLLVKIYLKPSHFVKVFDPAPQLFAGVSGESKFITNSCGIRGDELSSKYTKRILVVGGSAAECLYLDQAEAWPHLLQDKLNKESVENDFWVGNAGISGKNTNDHVLLLKYFPLKRLKIDTVILSAGINDFARRLSLDKDYIPRYSSKEEDLTFFKKSFIWRLFKELLNNLSRKDSKLKIQDNTGQIYATWRANRQSAKRIIDALPDLTSALREYAGNINAIIDIAKKNNVRIIFLTQPVIWRENLSSELQGLLWLGGIGDFQEKAGCEYYSVEALAGGMRIYNNLLLDICKTRKVECIDLDPLLPKDNSIFYDDCHFNENGSIKVSAILAQYLYFK